MSKVRSIAVLVPYFGKLPWYFHFFLHSCKYNPTIDFYIISDSKEIKGIPANVKVIYKTLEEVNILASNKLGFQTNIKNGYKLCDIKPAYGFIFSDLIKGYDFWGQSDVDIILGDLMSFFDTTFLNSYDYVGVRHDFPTGFFFLFRNNDLMNTLFMRSKDYKKVFSDEKHYCFDECNNVHSELTAGKSIFKLKTEIESFMHIIKDAEMRNGLRLHLDFICIEGTSGNIKFDKGKLFYKNRYEAILYHLIAFKRFGKSSIKNRTIPDKYNISSSRIYYR